MKLMDRSYHLKTELIIKQHVFTFHDFLQELCSKFGTSRGKRVAKSLLGTRNVNVCIESQSEGVGALEHMSVLSDH